MKFRCFPPVSVLFSVDLCHMLFDQLLDAFGSTAEGATTKEDESGEQPIEFTNSIGMRFRLIPAGEFMMGGPDVSSGR